MAEFKEGDRVQVKEQFDIPPLFRGGKPTEGIVDRVDGETVIVNVPIGDDDPEVHSQACFHKAHELIPLSESPKQESETDGTG